MKKIIWLFAIFILTVQNAICFAAETVNPTLEKSLKTTSSEPNFFTIASALLFVIILIYVTGLIYSKLNLVGAKAVREQIKSHDLSRVVILSTTQLGQGKNLHVIELNNKKYLIGASQNSITMLKELDNDTPIQNVEKNDIIEPNKEKSTEDNTYKKYL